MAALVVLLHTSALSAPEIYIFLANNINAPIVQIAVPTFFFMSGYLFFVGKEDFCFSVYKKKITKKVRTLLVPYIIWNFVALFLNYGYSYLTKGSLGDVMPWNLVEILWKHGEGIMGDIYFGVSISCNSFSYCRSTMVYNSCIVKFSG